MPLKKLKSGLALVVLTLSLTSCSSKKIIVHPIKDTDIRIEDNGDVCFSEYYFTEILKAKIEKN